MGIPERAHDKLPITPQLLRFWAANNRANGYGAIAQKQEEEANQMEKANERA